MKATLPFCVIKHGTFFRPFFRYVIVGGISTGIHFLILYLLVEKMLVSTPISNVGAFLVANGFSYFANSLWSFEFAVNKRRYLMFLVVSLIGVIFSYAIMSLGNVLKWHYLVSFCIQIIVMPLINFLLIRTFVFPHGTLLERGATENARYQ